MLYVYALVLSKARGLNGEAKWGDAALKGHMRCM
jgi:hypothetical protein